MLVTFWLKKSLWQTGIESLCPHHLCVCQSCAMESSVPFEMPEPCPCTYCGFAIARKHPSRCQCWAAIYCDRLCQRRDWRQHKATCIWYAIKKNTSNLPRLPPESVSLVCKFLNIAS